VAARSCFERVIGTAEPATIAPLAVNLVGEYNIAGDQDLIEPLLERAGFTVHARLTGNATFEEIRGAHRAHLNVVVCGRALINVARGMQQRWGVPYVEASFFGRTEIARSLRAMAAALAAHDPSCRPASKRSSPGGGPPRRATRPPRRAGGKKAVLYTGGVKSWSFISALQDLGLTLAAVGTKKATYDDEQKMLAILGPDAPLHENMSPAKIRSLMTRKARTSWSPAAATSTWRSRRVSLHRRQSGAAHGVRRLPRTREPRAAHQRGDRVLPRRP